MHAAEQPAETERDDHGRIGLRLDGVAQRFFERAGGLARRGFGSAGDAGGTVARLAVNVLGGVLHFAGDIGGLLLGIAESAVEIGILGTGLGHWVLPLEKCRGTTPETPKGSANRNVYGVAGLFRQHVVSTEGKHGPAQ